jgi:hypothetical protein
MGTRPAVVNSSGSAQYCGLGSAADDLAPLPGLSGTDLARYLGKHRRHAGCQAIGNRQACRSRWPTTPIQI